MGENDASTIVVMKGLEAVRRRPGMFFGEVRDGSGMHQMFWDVLGNAIDEHLRGGATHVSVEIEGDAITVEDDGSGIPVDAPGGEDKPMLELVFTRFHVGSKSPVAAHVHLGPELLGVGLGPVSALSARLEVKVWRAGRIYRADFERGEIIGTVRDEGPTARTGTRVRFTPDFTILGRHPWDRALIGSRLRTLTALNPGLVVHFHGETFHSPDGLADHVLHLARGLGRLHAAPFRLQGTHADIGVEVALLWTEHVHDELQGFVRQSPAKKGTHIEGFWLGLQRAFALAAPERLGHVGTSPLREVMGPGLVAVVSVALPHPRFGNPRRDCLVNPEVPSAVAEVMAAPLAASLRAQPELLEKLLRRVPAG